MPRRLLDVDYQHLAALRSKNLICVEQRPRERLDYAQQNFRLPTLSDAQNRALEQIRGAHAEQRVALLHGVTGSGKTEI